MEQLHLPGLPSSTSSVVWCTLCLSTSVLDSFCSMLYAHLVVSLFKIIGAPLSKYLYVAMCHITRGPPGYGGESTVASPIEPPKWDPNGPQNGSEMGPEDGPNLEQGRAQPGAGTCPTWTWDMPNLDMGHAQPGLATCPTCIDASIH